MPAQEINLLPPDRRRRARNESLAVSVTRIVKSINIGLLLLTTLAGAFVAALWVYSLAARPTTEAELTGVVDEYQALRDRVAEENAVLARLESLGRRRLVWSEVLQDFFAITPPGITLSHLDGALTFVDGEITAGGLTFGGQAVTRNSLKVYEEKMKGLAGVQQVNSPTSNLLERNNPSFQFSLVLVPE